MQGFSRDPASIFPALRNLLPLHRSRICDGSVEFNGLHYADELLDLWQGKPVCLRCSEEAESRAWIYLNNEILCEANAIELRRRNGTYRPSRPGA